jgi:type IV secretory pathway VirB10-like protein
MTDTTQPAFEMDDVSGATRSSEVFDRFSRPLVSVARTDVQWGFAAGLAGIAVLGVVVFLSLSGSRNTRPPAPASQTVSKPAAPLHATAIPLRVQLPAPPAAILTEAPVSATSGRLSAPAMIVDLSESPSSNQTTAGGASPTAGTAGSTTASLSAAHGSAGTSIEDDPFASRVSQSEAGTVFASQLHDTHRVMPQGTVVPAILETGINSDLPGFVRAVVSRDVHGFDGQTVLIPKGSKLIGEYRSATAAGYSRAFVVWSRLLTPDAVSVDIGSPATDQIGQGGVSGETNSHFFERFGSAILLSVLTTGMQAAANSTANPSTAIVISSPEQANNVATIALQKNIDVPTTITVPQGTPVRVFVAHDLDFSGVPVPKQ